MNKKGMQIKIGALISYVTVLINIISGLFYTPWILKVIGESNYGLYSLAVSLISLFVIDFGLSAAVNRFVSLYLARKEKHKADSFIGLAYKCYIVLDIFFVAILVVIYLFIDEIYKKLTPAELGNFKTIYLVIAVYNIIQFPFINLNGVLCAYGKFIQLKICNLINKLIIVVATIISLSNGGGLYELVTINAISGVLTVILKILFVWRSTDSKICWKTDSDIKLKEVAGFSVWSTIISIASRLIFVITPSILGAISGSISIALFGFASTLEGYVFSIADAVNGMFFPSISQIYVNDNKKEELLNLMITIGRLQIHVIGLIIVGFIIVGDLFINKIWLGSGYESLYLSTVLLIIPSYINLPQQIANTAMMVENKVKHQALVFCGMALINMILLFPLSNLWGARGACVSIFIAYIFRAISMNVLYKKVLDIDIKKFYIESYAKITPFHLCIILIGLLAKYLININKRLEFYILGFGVVLLYITTTYVFIFNNEEKNMIGKYFNRGNKKK